MSKKDVANFLTGINCEGVEYYFTSYTSGERAKERAIEAGVDPELAEKLRVAGDDLADAETRVRAAMKEIGESFGLEEADYEY